MIYNNVTRNWTNYNYCLFAFVVDFSKQYNWENKIWTKKLTHQICLISFEFKKKNKSFIGFCIRRCGGPIFFFLLVLQSKRSNRSGDFQSWHLFIINFISFFLSLSLYLVRPLLPTTGWFSSVFHCDFKFRYFIMLLFYLIDFSRFLIYGWHNRAKIRLWLDISIQKCHYNTSSPEVSVI